MISAIKYSQSISCYNPHKLMIHFGGLRNRNYGKFVLETIFVPPVSDCRVWWLVVWSVIPIF